MGRRKNECGNDQSFDGMKAIMELAETVACTDSVAAAKLKACGGRAAKLEHDGCYEDAAQICLEVLEVAPASLPIYRHVALELAVFGKTEDALETCRKAIELAPFDSESYKLSGEVCYEMGQYGSAIDAYRQAIELGTDGVESYLYLGHSYFALRRYKQAVEAYMEATWIEPDSAEANLSLGVVFNDLERYEEAVSFLTRYLELADDKHGIAQASLGRALFGLGHYREAATAYETALIRRPWCHDCYRGLIQAYEAVGQHSEVLKTKEAYKQVLKRLKKRNR